MLRIDTAADHNDLFTVADSRFVLLAGLHLHRFILSVKTHFWKTLFDVRERSGADNTRRYDEQRIYRPTDCVLALTRTNTIT